MRGEDRAALHEMSSNFTGLYIRWPAQIQAESGGKVRPAVHNYSLIHNRIEAVESKVGAVVDRLDSLYTSVARIEAFCRRNGAIFDAAGIGGTNPMDGELETPLLPKFLVFCT